MVSKVITRDLMIRDKHFYLCEINVEAEKRYGTIDYDWVTDGKMNRKVYGYQMEMRDSVPEAIVARQNQVEIDYLVSTGLCYGEAYARVHNMMDKVEDLKRIFEGVK